MGVWGNIRNAAGGGAIGGIIGGPAGAAAGSVFGGSGAGRGIWGNITGNTGRRRAGNDIQQGFDQARETISSRYPQAQDRLQTGFRQSQDQIRTGYGDSRANLREGYGQAINTAGGGYDRAISSVREGYDEAQGFYETDEIVGSRAELYNRVLGGGGYTPETLENMKAGAREEFGTGLREADRSLQSYYGDSRAEGMAGENLARATSSLGAERGRAVRDIDINNAMLKRQEQTSAIESLYREAEQRGGLSADEAQLLAGLEAERGNVLAGLEAKLAEGISDLTADEAAILADLEAKLASGSAQLTTDEAQLLAQLEANQGMAMAGTRNTEGLMPLIGSLVQGASAGVAGSMGG